MSLFARSPIPALAAIFVTGTIFPLSHPAQAQESPPAQAAPAQTTPTAPAARKATLAEIAVLSDALDRLGRGRFDTTLMIAIVTPNLKLNLTSQILLDAIDSQRFVARTLVTQLGGTQTRFEVIADGKTVTTRDFEKKQFANRSMKESEPSGLTILTSMGFQLSTGFRENYREVLETEASSPMILRTKRQEGDIDVFSFSFTDSETQPATTYHLMVSLDTRTHDAVMIQAHVIQSTVSITVHETIRSLGNTTFTVGQISTTAPKGFKKVREINPVGL